MRRWSFEMMTEARRKGENIMLYVLYIWLPIGLLFLAPHLFFWGYVLGVTASAVFYNRAKLAEWWRKERALMKGVLEYEDWKRRVEKDRRERESREGEVEEDTKNKEQE
jgi:hypothetical protein